MSARRERALDELLRAALVVEPPASLQARLQMLVRVNDPQFAKDQAAVALPAADSAVPGTAYLLVGLVAGAYAAFISAVGWDWLIVGLVEVWRAGSLLLRSPASPVIGDMLSSLGAYVTWLGVAPLIWYLWDRDRRDTSSYHS